MKLAHYVLSFFFFCMALYLPRSVRAVEACGFATDPDPVYTTANEITFSFTPSGIAQAINGQSKPVGPGANGQLRWWFPDHKTACNLQDNYVDVPSIDSVPTMAKYLSKTLLGMGCADYYLSSDHAQETVQLYYYYDDPFTHSNENTLLCEGTFSIQQTPFLCTLDVSKKTGIGDTDSTWEITVKDIVMDRKAHVGVHIKDNRFPDIIAMEKFIDQTKNSMTPITIGPGLPEGEHVIAVFPISNKDQPLEEPICDTFAFTVGPRGTEPPTPTPLPPEPEVCNSSACSTVQRGDTLCSSTCKECRACKAPDPTSSFEIPSLGELCKALDDRYKATCKQCIDEGKIWTAIGCVPTDFTKIINDYIFRYGIGIAGGLAFLRFLYGCFLVMTCQGNSETLEESKAIIMSALAGLFLIIFSVFFLRTIGIDILQMDQLKEGAWKAEHATGPLCVRQKGGQCMLSDSCVAGGKNVLSYSDRFGCEAVDPADICCVP